MSIQQAKKPSILARAATWLRGLFPGGADGQRRWIDYAFLGAFLLLLLVAATMSDVFFTQRNVSNLLRQIVTNGLISLGMLVVILTGGIDLSVGPVVAFSAIVVSGMIQNQHLPLPVAILIALGVGGSGRHLQRLHDLAFQAPAVHRHSRNLGGDPWAGVCLFADTHHT